MKPETILDALLEAADCKGVHGDLPNDEYFGLLAKRHRQVIAFRSRILRMFETHRKQYLKLERRFTHADQMVDYYVSEMEAKDQRIAELELAIEYLEPNHRLLEGKRAKDIF